MEEMEGKMEIQKKGGREINTERKGRGEEKGTVRGRKGEIKGK